MRLLVIFLTILTIMVPGCLSNVKDCKDNITCFQEAASNNCISAKVVYTNLGLTEYLETRGLTEGNCKIYMRIDQVPSALEQVLPNAEGEDMVCELPMTIVHKGLQDMYGLSDFCEGSLVSILSPIT
jgi:hypothetical protein